MFRKGFTLIEILAVIAILGVIAAIFIPSAIKEISKNEKKVYSVKETTLVNAAKDYVLLHEEFVMPATVSTYSYITVTSLINDTLTSKVLDSTSGNECNAFVRVSFVSADNYKYEACLLCENYTTDKSFCTSATYNNI